jgi:hypothetical protein
MAIILALKVDKTKPIRRGSAHIWRVIRKLTEEDRQQPFSAGQILAQCDGSVILATIKGLLRQLAAAGIVEETMAGLWRVVKRPTQLPHLTREGRFVRSGQEAMWNAIRALRVFTPSELAMASSTEERRVTTNTAKSYVARLYAAGYLALEHASTPKSQASYRLKPSMNTGPLAPKILRIKAVFDANREEVFGLADAEEVAP